MLAAYKCKKCGAKFELLIGVSMEKVEYKCPECGSKEIQKMLSAPSSVHVKGSGSGGAPSCPTGTCPFAR